MKQYKLVLLNEGLHWTREGDIKEAEERLNEYASQGWMLQQIITPDDNFGTMTAVMYKEF